MQFLKSLTFLFFVLLFVNTSLSAEEVITGEEKPSILEIEDKYSEVKLCLTKSSIYMQFKNSVKEYTNQEIEHRFAIEANQFLDTQGHFLLGSVTFLESDKLEYSLDDIKDVTFENGKLSFSYHNQKSFIFSDILNTDGTQALNNFYIEDLEKFFLSYSKLTSEESNKPSETPDKSGDR